MTATVRATRTALLLAAAAFLAVPGLARGGSPPPAGQFGADAPPPASVDFPTAVARALRNNSHVVAAARDGEAAARDVASARGNYLPSLVFEERFVRTDLPAEAFALKLNQSRFEAADFAVDTLNDPDPRSDFVTALTLEQPIVAPRAALGMRMAEREARARNLDAARVEEETVYRVLEAYLGVLTAKEYARIAARAEDDAREHLRIAEASERAGSGLASDVLRAKVFLARAEGERVSAEARLAVARLSLGLTMGERGGVPVDAAAPVPAPPPPGSLDGRIAALPSARSDLQSGSLRVENAGAGVAAERSDYIPTVGLFAAYQLDAEDSPFSTDNRSWKVGVGLRWNLFDGLRREAAAGKAAAEEGKARARWRGAADRAAFEVARAHLRVDEEERKLAIARAALAAAEEGARIVRARYANQRARMIDLLDAQTALDAARADIVKAENDLLLARAGLELASGTLRSWGLSAAAGGAESGPPAAGTAGPGPREGGDEGTKGGAR